jgi:hypothetical protein
MTALRSAVDEQLSLISININSIGSSIGRIIGSRSIENCMTRPRWSARPGHS